MGIFAAWHGNCRVDIIAFGHAELFCSAYSSLIGWDTINVCPQAVDKDAIYEGLDDKGNEPNILLLNVGQNMVLFKILFYYDTLRLVYLVCFGIRPFF